MKLEKVSLEGRYVLLEPLAEKHRNELIEAISDGELWNLFVTLVPRVEGIDEFIANAISTYESGDGLAFATIDKASGRVVGSTRFMKTNLPNKRLEIGFTFIAQSYQKTMINTEAKLLMLTHAFDVMALNRVEFITDYLNNASRNAILRLGAKQEAIMRNHMIMPDGRVRDSVLFSITNYDWAGIKQNLSYKLSR